MSSIGRRWRWIGCWKFSKTVVGRSSLVVGKSLCRNSSIVLRKPGLPEVSLCPLRSLRLTDFANDQRRTTDNDAWNELE